ncbi:MAG: alpha/beta hydrolase [Erysipelotrichaceae bacterium]|nr:alpha/beta hydrolase [Erysipelotrichaceae bacterium]
MKLELAKTNKQLRLKAIFFNMIIRRMSAAKFKRLHVMADILMKRNIKDISISKEILTYGNDKVTLPIYVYKSHDQQEKVPGVLWLHGGGYAMGSPSLSIGIISKLIAASGCVVVAPDYRLSTEKPYPAALDDCHQALLWMRDNANQLNIRDDQLMVGGESAGGGLAIALSLYERDHNGVKIAFQMPIYPMIDDRMINESAKNNNDPVWGSKVNKVAWQLYLSDLNREDVPIYAAPARAEDLSNLPPLVSYVGDLDPFKDEISIFVDKLKMYKIPVFFNIYKGCYHAFDIVNSQADVSKEAHSFFINAFKYAVENYYAKQNDI